MLRHPVRIQVIAGTMNQDHLKEIVQAGQGEGQVGQNSQACGVIKR